MGCGEYWQRVPPHVCAVDAAYCTAAVLLSSNSLLRGTDLLLLITVPWYIAILLSLTVMALHCRRNQEESSAVRYKDFTYKKVSDFDRKRKDASVNAV